MQHLTDRIVILHSISPSPELTSINDTPGLIIYVALTFFLFPATLLGTSTLFVYIGYRLLRLQHVVPFRKVVFTLAIIILLYSLITRLFDMFPLFFVLPVQIIQATGERYWSVTFSNIDDPLGLVKSGYIIHIPYHLLLYNVVVNVVTMVCAFFATKFYLGLAGRKRFLLWLFLSLSTSSITYIVVHH